MFNNDWIPTGAAMDDRSIRLMWQKTEQIVREQMTEVDWQEAPQPSFYRRMAFRLGSRLIEWGRKLQCRSGALSIPEMGDPIRFPN